MHSITTRKTVASSQAVSPAGDVNHGEPLSGGVSFLRYRLARWMLWLRSLGSAFRQAANWLEMWRESLTDPRTNLVVLEVDSDEELHPAAGGKLGQEDVQRLLPIGHFLASLGIHRIELEPRLESNQIQDILTLLYAYRRDIRHGQGRSGLVQALRERGVAFVCSVIILRDGVLSVRYSYCTTCFSRLVAWFERRQRRFSDHRALFRAAPRFSFLLSLVIVVVFLIYTFVGNWWVLLGSSLFGAALVFVMTYLFFMTVGSLEYDNEEKAHNLGRAYEQLKLYADQIHADLERARAVQQRLLPDPQSMPQNCRLQWARSFAPEAEVGGDHFSASALDDHRVAILFSDVSGHGMAASLVTVIIQTAFQAWVESGGELLDLVRELDRRLFDLTPDDSFAAVVACIYDRRSETLEYINCGHHPHPCIIRAGSCKPDRLDEADGLILGVQLGMARCCQHVHLGCEDTLVFATDGITEASNLRGEMFGEERLWEILTQERYTTPQELVDRLVREVEAFAAEGTGHDDQTILAVRPVAEE